MKDALPLNIRNFSFDLSSGRDKPEGSEKRFPSYPIETMFDDKH